MILNNKKMINSSLLQKRINDKNIYKNFCMFIIGMLFSSIAVSVFYQPNDVVTTGSTGLAIIISYYINVDLSLIVFAFSSILLMIGFAVFGTTYGAKNILGTILYPIFIKATTLIMKVVSFENTSLFLLILIGGVLSGIGFGMIKKSGYSLGGFYVLYDILNKKFKISIGKASLICNVLVVVLSVFTFSIDKCIYAVIGLYISSEVADRIMLGISRNKAFYIITKKPLEVRDFIVNNLDYTVTIVNARGGYSNKKKNMLMCVIPTIEYQKVKEVIMEIDKSAFFLITDSYSVSRELRKNM